MAKKESTKRKRAGLDSSAKRQVGEGLKRGGSLTASWVKDLRYGQSLSVDFFKRNAWLLIVIMVTIISMIGLRYKTKTKMEEIKSLTRELEVAQSEKLQEKAAYMSLIRETEMKRLVDEKHLGLQFREAPPYHVEAYREE